MLPAAPSKPYELKVAPFELPRNAPAGTLLSQQAAATGAPLLLRQRSNTTMSSTSSAVWNKPPAASLPKVSGSQSSRTLPMLESTPMSSTYTPVLRTSPSGPQAPAPAAVMDSIIASEQEKAFPNPLAQPFTSTGGTAVPLPSSPELPEARPIVRTTGSSSDISRLPPVRRSTLSTLGAQQGSIISNPTPSEKRLSGMILPSLAERPPVFATPSMVTSGAQQTSSVDSSRSASPNGRRPLLRAPTNTPGEVAVLDPTRTLGPASSVPYVPFPRQTKRATFSRSI
jgi:hypothetical protein